MICLNLFVILYENIFADGCLEATPSDAFQKEKNRLDYIQFALSQKILDPRFAFDLRLECMAERV